MVCRQRQTVASGNREVSARTRQELCVFDVVIRLAIRRSIRLVGVVHLEPPDFGRRPMTVAALAMADGEASSAG